MIKIVRTDSENPHFRELVQLLDADLKIRDGEDHVFFAQYNKLDKINHVVLAYMGASAIACGAFKKFDTDTAEIKRMFVRPQFRGNGYAGIVLMALEEWALEAEFRSCVLETGIRQPEAIRLYQKAGYHVIPNYAQYAGVVTSVCMSKNLM